MGRILGIDTGGTFTDGVLYDCESEQIIRAAKTPTTQHDLMQCITNIIKELDIKDDHDIETVSLSTTLVTNAVVENKGIRSKLILVGANPKTVENYGHEYGLPDPQDIHFVQADIRSDGEVVIEPDWEAFRCQLMEEDLQMQAYAVVQMWGMVDPSLEKKAKEVISEVTGKPVICGHELSSKLNFMKRAVSCVLNSQVAPLFQNFLGAVEEALAGFGIHAPLVVVRSDAGVMSSDYAREKPVETLLSGPAASIWGALSLTDAGEGIVVDIGGTTSDIAIVKNRNVELSELGATVGDYRTATPSVNLKAIGIGGDSDVQVDQHGAITVGPRKVIPICTLAEDYPQVKERLKTIIETKTSGSQCLGTFYKLSRRQNTQLYEGELSNQERMLLSVLEDSPKDLAMICEETGLSRYEFTMDSLIGYGLVQKSGLTPTDFMHVNGDFDRWDREASELALTQFALQYGFSRESLGEKILDEAGYQIYKNIVSVLMNHQKLAFEMDEQLLRYTYSSAENTISVNIDTDLPLIGIGAPSHALLPRVAEKLNTSFICPDYAETANAVGAAKGEISVHVKVTLAPTMNEKGSTVYKVTGMNRNRTFEDLEEAEAYAIELALVSAEEEAVKRGAAGFDLTYSKDDVTVASASHDQEEEDLGFLIESVVNAYAKSNIHQYGLAKERGAKQ